MASRRLALNLAQGLRNRASLNVSPLKRGFATPVNTSSIKTETTTLSNGLTVRMQLGPEGWREEVNWLTGMFRLPPSTRHGRRPRPLVSGLMLEVELRRNALMVREADSGCMAITDYFRCRTFLRAFVRIVGCSLRLHLTTE